MTLRRVYSYVRRPRGRRAREAMTEGARAARFLGGYGGLVLDDDAGPMVEPWSQRLWAWHVWAMRLRYVECDPASGLLLAL